MLTQAPIYALKWTMLATITLTGAGTPVALTNIETAARIFMVLPRIGNAADGFIGPGASPTTQCIIPIFKGQAWTLPYVDQTVDLRDFFVAGNSGDLVDVLYI